MSTLIGRRFREVTHDMRVADARSAGAPQITSRLGLPRLSLDQIKSRRAFMAIVMGTRAAAIAEAEERERFRKAQAEADRWFKSFAFFERPILSVQFEKNAPGRILSVTRSIGGNAQRLIFDNGSTIAVAPSTSAGLRPPP